MDKEDFRRLVRDNGYEINEEFIIIDKAIYFSWQEKWLELHETGYSNEEIYENILQNYLNLNENYSY